MTDINELAKIYHANPTDKNINTLLKACNNPIWYTIHKFPQIRYFNKDDIYSRVIEAVWKLIKDYPTRPNPENYPFTTLMYYCIKCAITNSMQHQNIEPEKVFHLSTNIEIHLDDLPVSSQEKHIENRDLIEKLYKAVKKDLLSIQILDLMMLGITEVAEIVRRTGSNKNTISTKIHQLKLVGEALITGEPISNEKSVNQKYNQTYYKRNTAKVKARVKKWQQENREKYNAQQRLGRQRRKKSTTK